VVGSNRFVEIDVRAFYTWYLSVYGAIYWSLTGFYDGLIGVNKYINRVINSLLSTPFDSWYLSVSVLYTVICLSLSTVFDRFVGLDIRASYTRYLSFSVLYADVYAGFTTGLYSV